MDSDFYILPRSRECMRSQLYLPFVKIAVDV